MKLWTLILLLCSAVVLNGLPLRPNKGRQNGRRMHYHRSGFFPRAPQRHIKFNNPAPRIRPSTVPVDTYLRNPNPGTKVGSFLRNGGSKPHNAAIYEVPSNRHYNDPRSGHELDLRLRSLVERYFNSDGNLRSTFRPPRIVATSTPTSVPLGNRRLKHIVKSPSSVLKHFLNVELREFHEPPVQTTMIDRKQLIDPKQTTPILGRRRRPYPTTTKSPYPLGLQFLNRMSKRGRQRASRVSVKKPKLPALIIKQKYTSSAKPTIKSTAMSSTTTRQMLPRTTTTTSVPKIVLIETKTTTTIASPLQEAELSLGFNDPLNDPLFSIDANSLFSDPDILAETQSAVGHGDHSSANQHFSGGNSAPTSHSHSETAHIGGHNHEHVHHSHASVHHQEHVNVRQDNGHNHHIGHTDHNHLENTPKLADNSHRHIDLNGRVELNVNMDLNGHSEDGTHGDNGHAHGDIHQTSDASNALDKLFVGMFNHHIHEDHQLKNLQAQEAVTPNPNQNYEKTTLHAKPITKRGISEFGRVSKRPNHFIDNVLNVRIWNTTLPQYSTHAMKYFVTTPPSLETQINRQKMSEYLSRKMSTSNSRMPHNTNSVRSTTTPATTPRTATPPAIPSVNVSQKELVHLQGIHIMFSNGKQDTSGKIPTIHLTASVSDKKKTNASAVSKSGISTAIPASKPTGSPSNVEKVVDKIVGTAVIRDGHLYLILYPYGKKKSLKLNFSGPQVSKIPLPHNKPISYTEAAPTVQHTTKPTIQTTEPTPTADMPIAMPQVALDPITSEYQPLVKDINVVKKHPTKTHAAPEHTSHHHMHMHHHPVVSSPPMNRAVVGDDPLQTILKPLNKFMSPWKSLNLSQVFPFPNGNGTLGQNTEDDNELDVVTFIAQATDPFERIKTIMESIANTTLFNNSSAEKDATGTFNASKSQQNEAKFNFELKIQTDTIAKVQDFKQTTQQTESNNSEEVLFDTSTSQLTQLKSIQHDVQEVIKPELVQNVNILRPTTQSSVSLMDEYLKDVPSTLETATHTRKIESKAHMDNPLNMSPITVTTTTEASTTQMHSTTSAYAPSSRPIPKRVLADHRIETEQVPVGKTATEPTVANESDLKTVRGETIINDNMKQTTPNSFTENVKSSFLHDSSILTTTPAPIVSYTKQEVSKATLPPLSTLVDLLGYTVINNKFSSSGKRVTTETPLQTFRNKFAMYEKSKSRVIPQTRGSNIQPIANSVQRLNRGQAEQVMSLSDILNDIRKIQLHNMHRFNIQNNNFNNLIVSEASRQNKLRTPMVVEGPLFRETSTRRFSSRVSSSQQQQRTVTPSNLQSHLLEQRQNAINDALDAMLVLSVDDILADHTTLHGAIVMSQRQRSSDQSSSNR